MQRTPITQIRSAEIPSLIRFLAPRAYRPSRQLWSAARGLSRQGRRFGQELGHRGHGEITGFAKSCTRPRDGIIVSGGQQSSCCMGGIARDPAPVRGFHTDSDTPQALNTQESVEGSSIEASQVEEEEVIEDESAAGEAGQSNGKLFSSFLDDENGLNEALVQTPRSSPQDSGSSSPENPAFDELWDISIPRYIEWSTAAWKRWQEDVEKALWPTGASDVKQETDEEERLAAKRMLRETPEYWVGALHVIGRKWKYGPSQKLDGHEPFASDLRAKGWVKLLFSEGRSVNNIRNVWSSMSLLDRAEWWPHIMLWLLENQTDSVMSVLIATYSEPYPSTYAVRDVIWYLCEYHRRKSGRYSFTLPNPFIEDMLSFLTILKPLAFLTTNQPTDIDLHIPPHTLWYLATRSNDAQRRRMLNFLSRRGFCFSSRGFCLMAYFFGRQSDYTIALRYLKAAIDTGCRPDIGIVASSVNMILRKSSADSWAHGRAIIAKLFELGVQLNVVHYTTIIENCFEANDISAALNIYEMLEENGVVRNSITYATMLRGLRDESGRTSRNIVRAAHDYLLSYLRGKQDVGAFESEECMVILGNEILYTMLLRFQSEKLETSSIYAALIDTFLQFFQPETLKQLTVLHSRHEDHSNIRKLKPDKATIHIMVSTFLMSFSHKSTTESQAAIWDVYSRYRKLSQSGHELMQASAESPYMASSFILAFGWHHETLPFCLKVITDMGRPISFDNDTQRELASRHALPNTVTYSTLVHALMRHKQAEAAEKVIDMMGIKGVPANDYTWNSLIGGYAAMQNVSSVGRALSHMQAQGVQPTNVTMTLLRRVQDRGKMKEVLERAQQGGEGQNAGSRVGASVDRWRPLSEGEATTTDEGTEALEWDSTSNESVKPPRSSRGPRAKRSEPLQQQSADVFSEADAQVIEGIVVPDGTRQ